ncbi:hypothetical protein ACFQ6V_12280 [Streptomyces roseifaciens]
MSYQLPDYGQGMNTINARMSQLQQELEEIQQLEQKFRVAWAEAIPTQPEIRQGIMDRLGLIDDDESPMQDSERNILNQHVAEVHAGLQAKGPMAAASYYNANPGRNGESASVSLRPEAVRAFDVPGAKAKMNAERARRGYKPIGDNIHGLDSATLDQIARGSGSGVSSVVSI